MHVQKETARYIVEDKKADYLFTAVKDNQPSLFAALDALDWENTPATHVMRDRGHGRDETRTLQVLPAPEDLGFPHAAQAFLIERTVRDPHDGQLRSAVAALGITSRSRARGGTPGGHRHGRPRSLGYRGSASCARHHAGRGRATTACWHIRPGHGRRSQHRHRCPAASRVHQHRARTAMRGT